MNFEKIFHGMVGKDFIKAFNDNFTIADKTFLDILAVLIYKVKSTDIKEFKVIDNVVSYTLEDAPEEGEDNRVWTPVDITKWSNITGNIEDQEDLWNILENKAALDTVQEISNLLNTLNSDFSQLKNKVETNEATLRVNTNDIADLLEEMTEKVNSTNIKAIRLNNAVFQWSPDGRTWYEQPLTTSIAWGHLTGDITTQEDLMALFTNIQNQFTELDGIITTIKNNITSLSTSISTVSDALETHIESFNSYKTEVSNSLSLLGDSVDEAKSQSNLVQSNLDSHLSDYDNPHHITKETLRLENVDNTSDEDKPVSTIQKKYIDNQISTVKQEIADKSGLVYASGLVSTLFVGNSNDYGSIGPKNGVLAFIFDEEVFTAECVLSSSNYTEFDLYKNGVKMETTTATATTKTYSEIPRGNDDFMIKVVVDGSERSFDIDMSFTTVNIFDIDILVEGGSE